MDSCQVGENIRMLALGTDGIYGTINNIEYWTGVKKFDATHGKTTRLMRIKFNGNVWNLGGDTMR